VPKEIGVGRPPARGHDGLDGGAGFEGDEADAAGLLGPEVQGNVAVHHRPELLEVPPEVVCGDGVVVVTNPTTINWGRRGDCLWKCERGYA